MSLGVRWGAAAGADATLFLLDEDDDEDSILQSNSILARSEMNEWMKRDREGGGNETESKLNLLGIERENDIYLLMFGDR
jgi:hypothetical protein